MDLDLIVCPTCFARVIPMSGNVCPSCRHRIERASLLELVEVQSGTHLPPYCHVCDAPATVWKRWQLDSGARTGLAALALLHPLAMLMRGFEQSKQFHVALELPLCAACRIGREPEPLFEEARVVVLVHRKFAQRLGR